MRSQIRLLGVDFVSRLSCEIGDSGNDRITKAIQMATRLSRAPVPLHVRSALYRTRVIPKAAFGWWFSDFPEKSKNELFAIYRKMGYVQRMCSRDLRNLLEGHNFCPEFQALSASIRELRKATSFGLPAECAWHCRVQKALGHLGWRQVHSSVWEHEQVGILDLGSDPKDLVLHQVRESWRRCKWDNFLNKNRRDSRMLHEIPFDGQRYKLAAKQFAQGSNHTRAVLTGAANSTAVYQVIFEGDTHPNCTWCGEAVVPSWDHLCWSCPAFARLRPQHVHYLLQRRLGWPMGAQNDTEVLQHLAAVRSAVLDSTPSHLREEGDAGDAAAE